jgi:hypothetical protein
MKKKTARRTPKTPTATAPMPHEALALLSYMEGSTGGSEGERPRAALAVARKILARPVPFDDAIGAPNIFDSVLRGEVFRRLRSRGDHLAHAITTNSTKDIKTDVDELLDLTVMAVNDSALVGAALMYELLKGGAK